MSQKPTKEQIDNLITIGLSEDVGTGDITTRSLVSENKIYEAEILAMGDMVLCGIDILKAVFLRLDPNIVYSENIYADGDFIKNNSIIIKAKGRGVALLEGERVALNILQRLCGIASLTQQYVERSGSVEIMDTRKTTPGLRIFEKYAVHCGGGINHRFGLYDSILIKDNHIKATGGIIAAVETAKKNNNTSLIEVETTSIREVQDAIICKSDIIMLDNMSITNIIEAVKLIAGRARIEVSGNVSIQDMEALSKTGIDCVSVGALTHSSKTADISMNFIVN